MAGYLLDRPLILCLNLKFRKYDHCQIDTWMRNDTDIIYYAKAT